MVEGRIELNSGETNDTEPRPTEEDSLSRKSARRRPSSSWTRLSDPTVGRGTSVSFCPCPCPDIETSDDPNNKRTIAKIVHTMVESTSRDWLGLIPNEQTRTSPLCERFWHEFLTRKFPQVSPSRRSQ
jgi:hypothetical protein